MGERFMVVVVALLLPTATAKSITYDFSLILWCDIFCLLQHMLLNLMLSLLKPQFCCWG